MAAVPVGFGERKGQPRQPALDEHADGARAEPVADGLQRLRLVAGSEPVRQLGEADAGLGGEEPPRQAV